MNPGAARVPLRAFPVLPPTTARTTRPRVCTGIQRYLLILQPTTLTDAIRRVNEGYRSFPPDLADRVLPRPASEALSEREVEVLKAIGEGMSNKEIGESLGIAESTVKGHVNHLFGKLGVTDRTKALVIAVRRGLIRID